MLTKKFLWLLSTLQAHQGCLTHMVIHHVVALKVLLFFIQAYLRFVSFSPFRRSEGFILGTKSQNLVFFLQYLTKLGKSSIKDCS